MRSSPTCAAGSSPRTRSVPRGTPTISSATITPKKCNHLGPWQVPVPHWNASYGCEFRGAAALRQNWRVCGHHGKSIGMERMKTQKSLPEHLVELLSGGHAQDRKSTRLNSSHV